jgi:hypothetical protein
MKKIDSDTAGADPLRSTGHASAGGGFPADVEFLNREAATFLEVCS